MSARSGLAEPPADLTLLDGFPAAAQVSELHRLSEHPGVWWYSSVVAPEDRSGGRFDLSVPNGTCYLAETFEGALTDKLLRTATKVVVAERLDELFHAAIAVRASRPVADLTARSATRFGLNAEVHTTLDYAVPRHWAKALWRLGWRGLRYRLRGDVAVRLSGRALFGTAGLHRRAPAGMSTTLTKLDIVNATRLLATRGVEVRPIPAEVTLDPPPR